MILEVANLDDNTRERPLFVTDPRSPQAVGSPIFCRRRCRRRRRRRCLRGQS